MTQSVAVFLRKDGLLVTKCGRLQVHRTVSCRVFLLISSRFLPNRVERIPTCSGFESENTKAPGGILNRIKTAIITVKTRPTSPASPTTPTTKLPEEDSGEMIPERRSPPLLTDDGLIAPRKPINPVREDPGRQNLHRELLFNQKIGKNVLNQKSELQRALEKHKDNVAKKQLENHVAEKTPELEKVIADRARRLENPTKQDNEEDKVINKEFLQARMKLKSTSESK